MADVNPNAALSEEDIQFLETRTGPIPGQSLTNNTDNKYPWEQPPMFTNRREAEVYILEELTTPESFIAITDILAEDSIDPDNQEKIFDKANDVLKKQIRKIDSGDIKPPAFMNKEIEEKLEAIPEETVEQAKSLLGPDKEEPQQSESLLGV